MFKITEIEIRGVWGERNFKTSLNKEANIFIGQNGTGKSTFLNIVQAVLSLDIHKITDLDFKEVCLKLKDGRKSKTIKIEKIEDQKKYEINLLYTLSRRKFVIPNIEAYTQRRIRRFALDILIDELRKELEKICEINLLSVHRIQENEINMDRKNRHDRLSNPIDEKLNELLYRFQNYRLNLESEISEESKKFQKNVLEIMLYDKRFDTYDPSVVKNEAESMKTGLIDAYKQLGMLDKKLNKKIEIHVTEINKSLNNLENNSKLLVNDVLPLSLILRTQEILKFSAKVQKNKNEILGPLNNFFTLLKRFINDKSLIFNEDIQLKVKKNNDFLEVSQLSSGEKQLLILFIETLLQKNKAIIFIADEPELSLHIAWQRNIISAIRILNPKSQIIIATHSPEICSKWKDNMIEMEKIIL